MPLSKYELKELIEELSKIRGRHTELVTVLIPAGQNINVVANQIDAEKSTADNIKSKTTRKNVMDALEMISRELKFYRKTHDNGIAMFAGNVSEKEGQQNIKLWIIEPPMPLRTRLYRCDKEFVLEPLQEMLEADEAYGLVVMDRKEATLALLEGKQVKILRKMTSGIPGKHHAGGQCLATDTLIMKANGEIIEIKDVHNPSLLVSENFNTEKTEETPVIVKWENAKTIFKITTKFPRFEISASQDHLFFIRTNKGIEEKPLSEIKERDYLLFPEKINLLLDYQKIDFSPIIKRIDNLKNIKFPDIINEELAKILGYYLGDGSYERDRLTFFEQRKEVADYYKALIEKVFGIEIKYLFRQAKNYHQLRVYSRIITQLFKYLFKEKDKTLNEKILPIVLKSPDSVLASFISGFFDAEGYVSERLALGINNKVLAKQLQFSLLRFGIISSINEYNNRRNPYSNKIRYTLAIDDTKSLKLFEEIVNFSSTEKREKLRNLVKNRGNKSNVRQLAVNGKEVAKIIRNSGYTTYKFNCPDFFNNKKQLSKEVFKERILNQIENEELKRRLGLFYNSNLIIAKISQIEKLDEQKTIDIETKNHNFIANCLIVHNSSQRFERQLEGLAKEYYRRVAAAMKELYFNLPKLKGIILGGPVPTKEDFLKEGQLVTALKDKVIGMKDIGYSDEHGIDTLVKESKDILEEQEIIKEQKILDNFFEKLGKGKKAVHKKEAVEKALKIGAVDTLILSNKLKKAEIIELTKKAESISAKVEIVSVETSEGEQFFNLGGIGAILRFEI